MPIRLYAAAFWLTAVVSDSGLGGIAGDVVDVVDVTGVAADVADAPPFSHGFGGDAIVNAGFMRARFALG